MGSLTASNVGRGIVAGFAGTVVLTALILIKQMMGVMPELDIIAMLSKMMGNSVAMAWIGHFMIGSVIWGVLYVVIQPSVPGPSWFRGALFATGAWLLMMIMVMPMAGAGLFGTAFGIMAPMMTLVLHWIYGAVLGLTYAALTQGATSPARAH